MAGISPDKHTVSGHVDIYTAIYLEEFASLSGWSRSKIIGTILDSWHAPAGSEIDVNRRDLHRQTMHNLRTGKLSCLKKLFHGRFSPVPFEQLDGPEPADYKEKVRLFASRALAGRLEEFYPTSTQSSEQLAMVADPIADYGDKSHADDPQRTVRQTPGKVRSGRSA